MLTLLPKPTSILPMQGEFILSKSTVIPTHSSNEEIESLANYLKTQLETIGEKPKQNTHKISLALDDYGNLGTEGYKLDIRADGARL